jgi:hypothetical protein
MFIYFLTLIIKIFLIVICRRILFNKLSKLNFFYFGIILGVLLVFIDIKLHDFYLDHKISMLSNSSEVMDLEDLMTDETKKLVGYIMPILEAEKISSQSKSNIKSILWNYKDNLKEKLIKENYDKSKQS